MTNSAYEMPVSQDNKSQFCKQKKTHRIYREVDSMKNQAFAYNLESWKIAETEIKLTINQKLFDNRHISEDMYRRAKILILKQQTEKSS